jgi:sugar lactone lactonase YvrE
MAPASGAPPVFPETVSLPDGWEAEGVATGRGTDVYAGSLASGAVWKADLRTGEGSVLVDQNPGGAAVGLAVNRGVLFVAGGLSGQGYAYDADTGEELATLDLGLGFVNDVIVTRQAAWFTNSFTPEIYRVALAGGVPTGDVDTVPLTGDWTQVPVFFVFNANGIEATSNGKSLIIVNSTVGALYEVDPATGTATQIETDTELTSGDGILLRGRELSVVRNRLNEIAVLELSPDLSSATLVDTLTDPDFAVPTTVASFGGTLYAVNARFGTPPEGTPYEIVKVDGTGPRR